MADSNRRKWQRYKLDIPTRVDLVTDGGERVSIPGRTRDINSFGAFVYLPDEVPPHSKMKVNIYLLMEKLRTFMKSDRVHVQVIGHVTRKEQNGVAIEFSKPHKITPAGIEYITTGNLPESGGEVLRFRKKTSVL